MKPINVDRVGFLADNRPDLKTITTGNIHLNKLQINPGYSTTSAERLLKKYKTALRNIPAPGKGCHPALLSVANLGRNAGYSRQQIFDQIRAAIPQGARMVSADEIFQAIAKALETPSTKTPRTSKQVLPIVRKLKSPGIKQAVQRSIIDRGGHVDINELSRQSPVPLRGTEPHMITLLKNLYLPNDNTFIGRRTDPGVIGDSIRTPSEWIDFFQEKSKKAESMPEAMRNAMLNSLSEEFPHIMPNPLSGLLCKTKSGKETYRGDACVNKFRFAVGEFDVLSEDKQLSFWRGLGLPLCALIHSGGKSIHAWLKVDGVNNAKDWERIVEQGLFPMIGILGADTSCKNESRLSRLPGMFRTEKNQWQRLLWLCPEGGLL
jgi:hypothetical protein